MGRLTILHILESDAQDIDLFQGRVDQEKCNLLFKHWIDISAVDTAFICGPEPMMLEIVNALRNHGLRDGQIKFELFVAAQHGRLAKQKKQRYLVTSQPNWVLRSMVPNERSCCRRGNPC